MSQKHFLKTLLSYSVLVICCAIGANCLIDPFSVFGVDILPKFGQPQERYLKIEFLKKNPGFKVILLGSSMMGVIRTEDVEKYLNGKTAYNMAVSAINQWDNLKHIQWLVDNYAGIEEILIQIDWPERFGGDKSEYKLLTAMHPEVVGRNRLAFLSDYLTMFSIEAIKAKIHNNFGGIDQLAYEIEKGYWERPLRDQRIDSDCADYVGKEASFQSPEAERNVDSKILYDNLKAIEKYINILKAKGLRPRVFLSPHNKNLLSRISLSDYQLFLRSLSDIVSFHNFMIYSSITINNCNYYEYSHYRGAVGEKLMEVVCQDKKPGGDQNWFRFVSKDNIDTEVEFIKSNFRQFRSSTLHLAPHAP